MLPMPLQDLWYRVGCKETTFMAAHSERRGRYLIEASAYRLSPEGKYQPRLVMTRLETADQLPKSQSFPGLSPLFETAGAAVRFATNLGRHLIDEKSPRLRI
jgi:hypothetical protein